MLKGGPFTGIPRLSPRLPSQGDPVLGRGLRLPWNVGPPPNKPNRSFNKDAAHPRSAKGFPPSDIATPTHPPIAPPAPKPPSPSNPVASVYPNGFPFTYA